MYTFLKGHIFKCRNVYGMFYDLWNGRMVVHMDIKGGDCQSEVNTKWLHDLFRYTETKIIIRLHLDVICCVALLDCLLLVWWGISGNITNGQ